MYTFNLRKAFVDLFLLRGVRGKCPRLAVPRTVYRISSYFSIPLSSLNSFLRLQGNETSGTVKDNRDIVDKNSSQKLSREEIEAMRDSGTSGEAVMAALIENSDTFAKKTKFSQAKFLKKKARKYFEFLVIRRPTLRLLAQIAYKGDPMKVLNLRVDSLAQLLCQGRMLLGESIEYVLLV